MRDNLRSTQAENTHIERDVYICICACVSVCTYYSSPHLLIGSSRHMMGPIYGVLESNAFDRAPCCSVSSLLACAIPKKKEKQRTKKKKIRSVN